MENMNDHQSHLIVFQDSERPKRCSSAGNYLLRPKLLPDCPRSQI